MKELVEMEVRELLSSYNFPGDDPFHLRTPLVRRDTEATPGRPGASGPRDRFSTRAPCCDRWRPSLPQTCPRRS